MYNDKVAYIFVLGNSKGGAGKTTCAMHLISALLNQGYKVASIDVDTQQNSLSNYLNNRKCYNEKHPKSVVLEPNYHFTLSSMTTKNIEHNILLLENLINELIYKVDYLVIDTPGHVSDLSKIAHSYADTIITPINDSFLDLDVIAKISNENLTIIEPSVYSQMIWEQKIRKASRNSKVVNWIIVRNRLSNLDALNKRKIFNVLTTLSKRIGFSIGYGFSERVIFKELFLEGLTILDVQNSKHDKDLRASDISARYEIRQFLYDLKILNKNF